MFERTTRRKLLLGLCATAVTSSVRMLGQSQQDTVNWAISTMVACGWQLQTHMDNTICNPDVGALFTIGKGKGMMICMDPNSLNELEYAKVTAVSYSDRTGGSVGRITFLGEVMSTVYKPDGSQKDVRVPSVYVDLYAHPEMGPRLVKAFIHLAQINGATVTAPDIF